ncbi:Oidioi.mRNA.OKI2018_I69.chr1.g1272.t1.cds [Oikopleura dioica]|uniref:Oidioi.mRNA.OKI2018_I69.chr1.g1272.t1.cds n=1 Tax=Oikopleura dioica TaxID=34765 RepID=A0ABN7SR74_OIKDI|nr:Oidioi.mRNA.OKI2018_I69.chr1.g1272.t1.cds [Oikopleura dioica]
MKIFGSFLAFAAAQENCDGIPKPKWVARKAAQNLFRSDSTTIIGVKLANYRFPTIELRDEKYRGFMVFTENVCGADFTSKLASGEVQVDLMDATDAYEITDVLFKEDGRYSYTGFGYRLKSIVNKDYPFKEKKSFVKKIGAYDQVQILFKGLDKVTWESNQDNCLLRVAAGFLPEDDDYPENLTECVFEKKRFLMAPPAIADGGFSLDLIKYF